MQVLKLKQCNDVDGQQNNAYLAAAEERHLESIVANNTLGRVVRTISSSFGLSQKRIFVCAYALT